MVREREQGERGGGGERERESRVRFYTKRLKISCQDEGTSDLTWLWKLQKSWRDCSAAR